MSKEDDLRRRAEEAADHFVAVLALSLALRAAGNIEREAERLATIIEQFRAEIPVVSSRLSAEDQAVFRKAMIDQMRLILDAARDIATGRSLDEATYAWRFRDQP